MTLIKKMLENVGGIAAIILIIILVGIGIILGPAILIWSINVLLSTTIAWTFKTWLASMLVLILLNTGGEYQQMTLMITL